MIESKEIKGMLGGDINNEDNGADCFGDLLSMGDDENSQMSVEPEVIKKEPPKLSTFGVIVKEAKDIEPQYDTSVLQILPKQQEGYLSPPPIRIPFSEENSHPQLKEKDVENNIVTKAGALEDPPNFLGGLLDQSDTDEEDGGPNAESKEAQDPLEEDLPEEPKPKRAISSVVDIEDQKEESKDKVAEVETIHQQSPSRENSITGSNKQTGGTDILKSDVNRSSSPLQTSKNILSHSTVTQGETTIGVSNTPQVQAADQEHQAGVAASNTSTDNKLVREQQEKMSKFKSISKTKQFQTQILSSSTVLVKEEDKSTEDDFLMLRIARDCISKISMYGQDIKKWPFGENQQEDVEMRDYLEMLLGNPKFYPEDIKGPLQKILEKVGRRVQLISELKVVSHNE